MANISRFQTFLLATGWTLGILIACSIPGHDIPDIGFDLFEYDKLVHFALFVGFGWLWSRAIPKRFSSRFVWIGLAGLMYAVGTEIYQGMLPWERTPDPMDAMANMLGLLLSILVHERARLKS